ncbi:hypothetical protein AAMO2058_001513000, partial [Amorphochlora amoebiformis]
ESGKTKHRPAFEIDWKRVDLDGDGEISKWEFRTRMDLLLSDHFSLKNPKFLEECKNEVKQYDIGKWWENSEFFAATEDKGNWFSDDKLVAEAVKEYKDKVKKST